MSTTSSPMPGTTAQARAAAYTTARADVFALVPNSALSVLDVGCSNGELGAALRAAVPGRRVSGIELDADFARHAAERLDRVVHANLDRLDWAAEFSEQRFDCIVFADVLEHLVDPGTVLSAAARQLNTGGSVVVSLPNVRHLSALVSIYLHGRFPRRDRGLFDRTHLRWFTRADGRQLMLEAGLQIDAESAALRAGDRGGGRLNRALNALPARLQRWSPIGEFLAYQFCIRGRLTGVAP